MKKMYLLALISALICGFLLYAFLGKMEAQVPTDDLPRTDVLVAVQDIPAYAELNPSMFDIKSLPMEAVHFDSVTDYAQIEGMKSSQSYMAGEVMLRSKFGKDVESFASYQVPEGMRVMTVAVGSTSGLDQYLMSGDLVDVMFTAFAQRESDEDEEDYRLVPERPVALYDGVLVNESITTVILEAVEVFTTGSALDAEGVPYGTVTLILTPQDCLRLYASQNYGTFSFALRGHKDTAPANTQVVKAEDIVPAY